MPSTTYHASDFVRAAARLGVPVTVGTDGSQVFQELVPGSTITLDFDDLAAARTAVAEFHRCFPIGAVVAADDETTRWPPPSPKPWAWPITLSRPCSRPAAS